MNVPIELIGKDGRPIPPEESPIDERTPPATTCTENPFKRIPMSEMCDRYARLSCDQKAKIARRRKAKQKAQKTARKRNRK